MMHSAHSYEAAKRREVNSEEAVSLASDLSLVFCTGIVQVGLSDITPTPIDIIPIILRPGSLQVLRGGRCLRRGCAGLCEAYNSKKVPS
jgi:hypothetical protein